MPMEVILWLHEESQNMAIENYVQQPYLQQEGVQS